MPQLRRMSGRDCRAILEANGFIFVRQSGSHIILQQRTEKGTITVSVPNHRELAIGTLGGIVRQSGMARDLFEV